MKKSPMPHRIESLAEVHSGKHCPHCRLSLVEAVSDSLRQAKKLVKGRSSRSEARLEGREDSPVLDEEFHPFENHLLEDTGECRGKRDRSVRRRGGRRLTGLKNGHDLRDFPERRKRRGGPRVVEDR